MTPADHQTLALAAASAASTAVQELIEAIAREVYAWNFCADPDGEPRHGYASWDSGVGHPFFESGQSVRHARKVAARIPAAIRASGYALVRTEGEEFEAMVERAAEAIYDAHWGQVSRAPWPQYVNADVFRRDARVALRAFLTPGDDANG